MALLLVGAGVIISILGSLLGIGGGVILVPFLVLGLHVPIHQAVATSLVAIIATSSQVAAFGEQHGFTNIRLALLLNAFTILGATLGSLWATRVEEEILRDIFAGAVFVIAFIMLIQNRLKQTPPPESNSGYFAAEYYDPNEKRDIAYRPGHVAAAFGAIFVSGAFSGMIGTSGGIFNVPVLSLVSRVPIRAAAATSSLMIGLTAVAGTLVYYQAHFIRPALATPIVLGIMLGSWLGTRLSVHVHSKWLRRLFIVLLLVTALKMIMA
ncbi:MAG: sulfite exporter TauE/SafE family protein [Calditrichaeota bacterium]|nr:MAG: sulfite exporter TauE/SafE family protein [Calditrichota bacterium]